MSNIIIPYEFTLADGVALGQEHTVQAFPKGDYGYQTAERGAVARVTPRSGIPITNLADGVNPALVRIGEGNAGVKFLLLKHDYENSGGSLLLRQDIYDRRAFNANNIATYANSDIDTFANGDYFALLEDSTRGQVMTVEIPYTIGGGNNTMGKLARRAFILSLGEVGVTDPITANVEGTPLAYFNSRERRIAYLNGVATIQWTRTPDTKYPEAAFRLWPDGAISSAGVKEADGFRPAIVVPGNFMMNLSPNSDGTYSPVGSAFADA